MQKIARFCIFWCHSAKKIQVPADRTILMPAAQPIAHFEHYAPNFARKIFILMTLLKFGSQQAPKSVYLESCHSKNLFCSPIQDLMILQAVRILLTLREWFVHASSQCVLRCCNVAIWVNIYRTMSPCSMSLN